MTSFPEPSSDYGSWVLAVLVLSCLITSLFLRASKWGKPRAPLPLEPHREPSVCTALGIVEGRYSLSPKMGCVNAAAASASACQALAKSPTAEVLALLQAGPEEQSNTLQLLLQQFFDSTDDLSQWVEQGGLAVLAVLMPCLGDSLQEGAEHQMLTLQVSWLFLQVAHARFSIKRMLQEHITMPILGKFMAAIAASRFLPHALQSAALRNCCAALNSICDVSWALHSCQSQEEQEMLDLGVSYGRGLVECGLLPVLEPLIKVEFGIDTANLASALLASLSMLEGADPTMAKATQAVLLEPGLSSTLCLLIESNRHSRAHMILCHYVHHMLSKHKNQLVWQLVYDRSVQDMLRIAPVQLSNHLAYQLVSHHGQQVLQAYEAHFCVDVPVALVHLITSKQANKLVRVDSAASDGASPRTHSICALASGMLLGGDRLPELVNAFFDEMEEHLRQQQQQGSQQAPDLHTSHNQPRRHTPDSAPHEDPDDGHAWLTDTVSAMTKLLAHLEKLDCQLGEYRSMRGMGLEDGSSIASFAGSECSSSPPFMPHNETQMPPGSTGQQDLEMDPVDCISDDISTADRGTPNQDAPKAPLNGMDADCHGVSRAQRQQQQPEETNMCTRSTSETSTTYLGTRNEPACFDSMLPMGCMQGHRLFLCLPRLTDDPQRQSSWSWLDPGIPKGVSPHGRVMAEATVPSAKRAATWDRLHDQCLQSSSNASCEHPGNSSAQACTYDSSFPESTDHSALGLVTEGCIPHQEKFEEAEVVCEAADAHVNAADEEGPLSSMCATQSSRIITATTLLAAGAKLCAANTQGSTALLHTAQAGLMTILELRLAPDAGTSTSNGTRAAMCCIQWLGGAGSQTWGSGNWGSNGRVSGGPLAEEAIRGRAERCPWDYVLLGNLVHNNAEPSTPDTTGIVALMRNVRRHYPDSELLLLAVRGDTIAGDHEGATGLTPAGPQTSETATATLHAPFLSTQESAVDRSHLDRVGSDSSFAADDSISSSTMQHSRASDAKRMCIAYGSHSLILTKSQLRAVGKLSGLLRSWIARCRHNELHKVLCVPGFSDQQNYNVMQTLVAMADKRGAAESDSGKPGSGSAASPFEGLVAADQAAMAWRAADYFQVDALKEVCEELMVKTLTLRLATARQAPSISTSSDSNQPGPSSCDSISAVQKQGRQQVGRGQMADWTGSSLLGELAGSGLLQELLSVQPFINSSTISQGKATVSVQVIDEAPDISPPPAQLDPSRLCVLSEQGCESVAEALSKILQLQSSHSLSSSRLQHLVAVWLMGNMRVVLRNERLTELLISHKQEMAPAMISMMRDRLVSVVMLGDMLDEDED